MIINIVISETNVFLLSIYDKSEMENMTDNDLNDLPQVVPE